MTRVFKLFMMMTLIYSTHVSAEKPESQWIKAFSKGHFTLPETNELGQVRKAYQHELKGRAVDDLWNTLKMQRFEQQDIVYFRESQDNRKGRGLFAINRDTDVKPWLIQAPHAKFDKYTGKLVEKIFAEGTFKAAMWNSIHRKTPVGNKTADMAHLPGTYWQAVTRSFADSFSDGKIIQFHGYAQSKRKTVAGRNSDMIISAGHREPPLWIRKLAQCLKKTLPFKVSLYPYDVRELGATTNIQGHLLQNQGFNGFLHIEMSKPLRQQLLKSRKLRQMLVNCIQ